MVGLRGYAKARNVAILPPPSLALWVGLKWCVVPLFLPLIFITGSGGVAGKLLPPFHPFVLSFAPAVAVGVPLSRFAQSPVWSNGAALFAYGAVLGGVCSLVLAGGASPNARGAFSIGV